MKWNVWSQVTEGESNAVVFKASPALFYVDSRFVSSVMVHRGFLRSQRGEVLWHVKLPLGNGLLASMAQFQPLLVPAQAS